MGLVVKAALILSLGVWRAPDHTGYAVHYGQGVMEGRAAANDPLYEEAPSPCYVAYTLAYDRDMGKTRLRIKAPYGTITCLVVDLPDDSKGHRGPLKEREVWAELGWDQRWVCGVGWSGRAKDCPITIWVIRR